MKESEPNIRIAAAIRILPDVRNGNRGGRNGTGSADFRRR